MAPEINLRRLAAADLPDLLRLYAMLHPEDPPVDADDGRTRELWDRILADENLRYYGVEESGSIMATCTLALIPNLTRGLRSYGLIENVITAPKFRRRGFATQLLRHALADAWRENCYKVMLATGSQEEVTLRFYEAAGFRRGVKTGFIAYPDRRG